MEIRFMAIGSERGTEEREMGEEKSKYRFPLPLRTCPPPPRPPLTSSRVLVKGWIQTKRRGAALSVFAGTIYSSLIKAIRRQIVKLSGDRANELMSFNENGLEIKFNELPAYANRPLRRCVGDLGIVSRGAGSGTRTDRQQFYRNPIERVDGRPSHRRRIHMPMMARCRRGTAFRHIFKT